MKELERLQKKSERLELKSLILIARIELRWHDLALFFETNNLYK
jgi:hypothetical protein